MRRTLFKGRASRPWPTTVVLVAVLSVVALALRATTHLDALEAELQARSAALVGDLEKAEKKDKKLFDGLLAQLDKTTDSAKKEIQLARKVGGKLAGKKPGDEVFADLLDAAATGLAADVSSRLSTVNAALNQLPTKVTVEKIRKKVSSGQAKLGDAALQPTYKKRMVRIAQAESAARSAEKLLAKLDIGPGGSCPGQAFAAGEGASVLRDGALVEFDRWSFEPVPQTGHRIFHLYRCSPEMELSLLIRYPQLGENAIGAGRNDDVASTRDSFTEVLTSGAVGTNDVTEYVNSTGTIRAAFSFTNGDGVFTDGALVITDFYR